MNNVKVKNLYKFLQEYNQVKNPEVLDFNQHPIAIDLFEIRNNEHSIFPDESNVLFEISKLKTKDTPTIPDLLDGWLDIDLIKDSGELENFDKKMLNNSDNFEMFSDSKERIEEFEKYRVAFEKWKLENNKVLTNNILFLKLYSNLYLKLEEEFESYELVLGSALLKYSRQNKNINHHLLTRKISIEFDSRHSSLIFSYTDSNIDLLTSLIRDIKGIDSSKFEPIRDYINGEEFSLIEGYKDIEDQLIDLLNRTTLDSSSEFTIENNNSLILIKKNYGYSRFIQSILDDIDANPDKDFPDFLIDLIDTKNREYHSISNLTSSIDEESELLLTLPFNIEQVEIASALKKNGAVLVQGPPGTGKTHTIANLIGHLLSEGKSVLVTAHTDKALSVLKSKVYKDDELDLQSLCISVGKDRSQRREMDSSINALSVYGNTFSEENVKKKIFSLENERKKIYANLEFLRGEYKRLKHLSYQDFVYDNKNINPIEAAKFVGEGEDDYDYLDFETKNYYSSLPVTQTELEKLYFINNNLHEEDIKVLVTNKEGFLNFWSIEDFTSKVNNLIKLKSMDIPNDTEEDIDISKVIEELETARELQKSINSIKSLNDWFNFSVSEKTKSKLLVQAFIDFELLLEKLDHYEVIKFQYDIQISEKFNDATMQEFEKRIAKNSQKPFKFFDGLINKELMQSFSSNLDSNSCDTLKHVLVVYTFERDIKLLINTINKYAEFKEEVISLTNYKKILHLIQEYKLSLTLYHQSIKDFFLQCSVEFIEFSDNQHSKVSEILESIVTTKTIQTVKYNIEKSEIELNDFFNRVQKFKGSSELYAKLVESVKNRDSDEYANHYAAISAILDKASSLEEFNNIIHKIELIAPTWAVRIRNKIPPHNSNKPPYEIEKAWKFTQLKQQLDAVHNEFKNDIEARISKAEQEQIENSRQLAHEKAWYRTFKKQTTQLQQDLVKWGLQMRRLPKTISAKSYKPTMNELNKLTPKCQSAIPLWIMPISQVVNIYNASMNQFDVVIIDEASQADMLSLAVLYLGKQIVVVGDDKQVSPSPVGIPLENIRSLQNDYLSNMSIQRLLNADTSIYTLAQLALFKKVVLKEHFRCVPDIIHFSNQQFYDMKIKPLRDTSGLPYDTYIIPHRVPNGFRDSRKIVNQNEAEEIVRLMTLMMDDEDYDKKTFGVITMVGHDQSKLILNMIQNRLGLDFIHKRKIQVGSASQFQGDERDIMFISFIDDKESIRTLNFDDGNNRHSKEYNVALSRAKDQMYLIHSFNPEADLKSDDIRAHLFSYAINPASKISQKEQQKTESVFEKEIFQALSTAGYSVKSQYKVSNYRIDLVVESKNSRVAIECDGEAFHTIDNYEEDLYRQNQLERLGWRFIRIRGSQYFSNKSATVAELIRKIGDLGIERMKTSNDEVFLPLNDDKYFEVASSDILSRISHIMNTEDEQEPNVLAYFQS